VAVVGKNFGSLLPVGFHDTDLAGLKRLCVDYFPQSRSRSGLFETVATLTKSLNQASIPSRLWIDGSFVTEQENPAEVDVTLVVVGPVFRSMTGEQRAFFDWFRSTPLYEKHRCYNYALILDGERDDWELLYRYWLRKYGFNDETRKKGIAEIVLPKLQLE